jgi:hypothetical protein
LVLTLEEATAHLKSFVTDDGGLFSLGWYLAWSSDRKEATLDGRFEADDLEAIAVYMRHHKR